MFTLLSLSISGAIDQSAFGVLFGVGAIIFLPIVYGIFGAIAGLIFALIYNLAAKLTGGIEMEFEAG